MTAGELLNQVHATFVRYDQLVHGNDAVQAVITDTMGEVYWEVIETYEELYGRPVQEEDALQAALGRFIPTYKWMLQVEARS